jgi:lipid A ethanolaminephosphotransferase
MHGMPMAVAPDEQKAIPFIVWESAEDIATRKLDTTGHYNIFHSVLDFMGISSEIYNAEMSVFCKNENDQ